MTAQSPVQARQQRAVPFAAGLQIRRVPLDAPWAWLEAGWRDMARRPVLSLGYGAVFSAAAFLILFGLIRFGWQSLFLALGGGFLLLGPLFAGGLYELSRRLAARQPVDVRDILFVSTRSPGQLAFFGVVLLGIYLAWIEIAMVLLALFMGGGPLPLAEDFLRSLLFTSRGLGLLFVGTGVGALLAAAVFAITAYSVPLLLARDLDVATAIATSLKAVRENLAASALWAVLIVVIMGAGALSLAGLIVAFPLIGHATWHAFRAVVELEAEPEIVPDVTRQ